jgi:Holliday junction resolvasome RuvABC endonuclease subunit
MKILALDLGTTTGWAIIDGKMILSGRWNLKGDRYEGGGMRLVRFRKYLNEVLDAEKPDLVVYEAVHQRALSTAAGHWYGAFWGATCEVCDTRAVPYSGQKVQDIKKFATGAGNAKKEKMVEAARVFVPSVADDNEADAIHLARMMQHQLSGEPR